MSRRSVLWDWPLVARLEAPCRIEEARCTIHGLRRELKRSGQCQVGAGCAPMLQAILGARRQAGPRELEQLAGATRTELDALVVAQAVVGALGEIPKAIGRALSAASRRAVPFEEIVSWVATWDEYFAVRSWVSLATDAKGHSRPDLRDQVELRQASLYAEIEGRQPPGAARLARWVDVHHWFYWSFGSEWHETRGRLFEPAVMLSRDGGYLLGADTPLVSAVEALAEEMLQKQESNTWPAWMWTTVPCDPYPRFTRPSDLLSDAIQAASTTEPGQT